MSTQRVKNCNFQRATNPAKTW